MFQKLSRKFHWLTRVRNYNSLISELVENYIEMVIRDVCVLVPFVSLEYRPTIMNFQVKKVRIVYYKNSAHLYVWINSVEFYISKANQNLQDPPFTRHTFAEFLIITLTFYFHIDLKLQKTESFLSVCIKGGGCFLSIGLYSCIVFYTRLVFLINIYLWLVVCTSIFSRWVNFFPYSMFSLIFLKHFSGYIE